jgi:hypothetical protein
LDRLRRDHIRITAQRTGGTLGQQVRFHTRTGEVFVRYIVASARKIIPPDPRDLASGGEFVTYPDIPPKRCHCERSYCKQSPSRETERLLRYARNDK